MEASLKSKPCASFVFEIEKIIGMTSDGRYQVQWAPAWVSKFHLVGCEHLIQEFLQQQSDKELNHDPEINHEISDDVNRIMEENYSEHIDREDDAEPLTFLASVKEENTDMEISTLTATERSSMYNDHVSALTISMNTAPVDDELGEDSMRYELSHVSSRNLMTNNLNHHVEPHDLYTQTNSASSLQTDTDSVHKCKYKCNMCGVEFSCKNTLNVHLKSHGTEYHSDNLWYSCDQCKSSFLKKSLFNSHICSHRTEKPYNCPHCDSKFKQKHHLKEHLQTHTDSRPFICEFCGKSFARKYALKTHLRTHTGDKPYICEVCGKAYSDKSNYNTHMRNCASSIHQSMHEDRI